MTRRKAASASIFASAAGLLISLVAPPAADASTLPAQRVPGMWVLYDISCRPDGTCLAVGYTHDNVGAVVLLRAGGPNGPVRPVPGTARLTGITCPVGGTCIAVGTNSRYDDGVVVEVGPDGMPGPARPAPGTEELAAVACPTTTTCIAIGREVDNPDEALHFQTRSPRFTVITNGQPGPAQRFAPAVGRYLTGIACPIATTCLVPSGSAISIITDTGAGWTATANYLSGSSATGRPGGPISCASRTLCMAVAHASIPTDQGSISVPAIMPLSVNGTVGSAQILDREFGYLADISCVGSRTCTVVGGDYRRAQGLLIDVVRGIPGTPRPVENTSSLSAVSCVGLATCGILGHATTGPVFLWYGPVPG